MRCRSVDGLRPRHSFDEPTWNEAVAAHEEGVARLEELGAPVVAASRARELDGKRVNEAFVGIASLPRWLVAMRMAAMVSGCYVLTSNRTGTDSSGQLFGGRGWVVDPYGDLVAQTSATTPVVFHEIDTDFVARAQSEYPCYVEE